MISEPKFEYWPHQNSIHIKCQWAFVERDKHQRSTIVAPCGGGKSLMMRRISVAAQEKGVRSAFYLHRKMLTRQFIDDFEKEGLDFGVVASGFKQYENPDALLQICSMQSVAAKVRRGEGVPEVDVYHVDEKHQQAHPQAESVFSQHINQGALEYGWTATPVDLGGCCDQLITDANYSDMRECGAHLPVRHYGPDRPDLSSLKPMKGGDFSSNDDKRINRVPTIIGSVFENWMKLNPGALPAIGFAPGVAESKWFVDEFRLRGVPCGHIDGERTIIVKRNSNGVLGTHEYTTDDSSRQAILDMSKSGEIKVIFCRFLLREAVNMPWLYHGIGATSMGGLSTWLQTGGRIQRYWPDYDHVVWQDHGANVDRHGCLDEDRIWTLGDTNNSKQKERKEAIQKKKGDEAEPICCPRCSAYRLHGNECQNCGHMHSRSVRMVRQLNGDLVRKVGRVNKYKRPKAFTDLYRSALYGAYNSGATVGQAMGQAKARAAKSGVEIASLSGIKEYGKNDREWRLSVREVYPWLKRK